MKLLNEVIRQLEDIESSLNQDTPNISDIRIDVALLIKELDEPHYVSGRGGQNSYKYEDIQIDCCQNYYIYRMVIVCNRMELFVS